MLLSFNIPTYNRCSFLEKNVNIIISQIREFDLLNDVEINISDNGSTDETNEIVNGIIEANKDIIIRSVHNERNIGPDKNYIQAMKMAHSNYSILWGDDDFLKKGALSFIVKTIKENPEVSLFISNRTNVDSNGNFIMESPFFYPELESHTFDFSNVNDGILYFKEVKSLGGCLTFISSVIYKTSILDEIGEYDERLTGTFYSFFFYWWGAILKGGKLRYNKISYINCTTIGSVNNNFGERLDRTLVDFDGFNKIGKILFKGSPYYKLFISMPLVDWPVLSLANLRLCESRKFDQRLLPLLREIGWTELEIRELLKFSGVIPLIKKLVKSIVYLLK